ncbi:MAG: TRAP transporter substrate-binding protein DctP [Deltaproteobacteria bacterium]|nr:TRAP transporter substrate-binding protein DctP [Deltaproteobacteria bacterium]
MKRKLVSILVGVLLIAGLVEIGHLSAASAAELTLSHMAPAGSILDKQLSAWAEKVKKDSNGKLSIRIFPGATLINPFETFTGIEKGIADLGSSYRYSRAGAELTGLISMFLAGVPDSASGSRIVAEVWKNFPEARNEWQTVKVLWVNSSGPAVVAATRPVRTMADLKGLELRTPVPEAADALRLLGGTPVSMTSADMVIGIKRGTVHGGLVFKEAIESFKLPVKYVTEFGMYQSSNWFLVMNLDSWNKLPADLQKVIDDSLEWGRNESIKAFDAADASAVEYGKKQGMEFIKLSAEEEARWFEIVDRNNRKHAADLDAKGYPATKVLEFINKIRK